MMLLVYKLRRVNRRVADSLGTRHSTMSVLSAKRTRTKEAKLRHFGKDASFVGLAMSTVKKLPRMTRRLKCLALVLMNELAHVDISDTEALWNGLVRTFHAGSDLLSKQMLVLFVSRFLNRFQAVKELNIEMKKNCSRNSQFQFRLMQSLSFNEENELKTVKRHMVQVIAKLFSSILGANFNDDTLLLAILRLGHVGRFSEDVIQLVVRRMLDLSLAHTLMLLCHKYRPAEQQYMASQAKKCAAHFEYDYRDYVASKDFEDQKYMLRFSRVEADPRLADASRVNSCQELNRNCVESQELNMSNFSKELISRSNLRIGINVPKKSRLVDIKMSKDFLNSDTFEGTLTRVGAPQRRQEALQRERGHESDLQDQLLAHRDLGKDVPAESPLRAREHIRRAPEPVAADCDSRLQRLLRRPLRFARKSRQLHDHFVYFFQVHQHQGNQIRGPAANRKLLPRSHLRVLSTPFRLLDCGQDRADFRGPAAPRPPSLTRPNLRNSDHFARAEGRQDSASRAEAGGPVRLAGREVPARRLRRRRTLSFEHVTAQYALSSQALFQHF